MARPTARKGSRHYQFRKRIPEDVLDALRSTPGWKRRGWGLTSGEITISLERERQPGETDKAAHARLSAEAEGVFAEVRRGVRSLTDAEIAALAGEAYALASAPDGVKQLGTRRKTFDLHDFALELVAGKGIRADGASVSRLLAALAGERGALVAAVEVGEARALGDFATPNKAFPEWPTPAPLASAVGSSGGVAALRLSKLVERFLAEHPQLSEASRKRYRPSLLALVSFLKDPLASHVTEEDIRAFKPHRLESGERTASTYYRGDLPAIKSLFKWATDRERHARPPLAQNPATNVRVLTDAELGRASTARSAFYEDECKAILRGASAVGPDSRDPTLGFAKRWCPWIAAYTGARIASITALRKEDVRKEGDVWFFTFPPAKGYQRSREVPLHSHLIELGFLDFLESRSRGPLFYDAGRKAMTDAASSPAQIRSGKLSEWVRKTLKVDRETVDPSHGWRHTFKTRAMDAGIPERISDAITGHSVRGKGPARSVYEHPSLKALAEAMGKFPRYSV